MAVIFMVSSSGYVVFTSKCLCTGEETRSIFIRPETCETTLHTHHTHDYLGSGQECSAGECHNCIRHEDDCGCGDPEVFIFRLKELARNEEAKFLITQIPLPNVIVLDIFNYTVMENVHEEGGWICNDPPPETSHAIDFLIRIHQLKIPSLA